MTTPETIELKFKNTNFYTRWPCTVCGGSTEKVSVLVEDAMEEVRCCENCLREGDLDGRLSKYVTWLEQRAAWLRTLIGRLSAPTYAELKAYEKRVDVALAVAHDFQGQDIDDTYNKIMGDDDVYAKWQKQLQQEEDDHNRQLENKRARRELLGISADVDSDLPF